MNLIDISHKLFDRPLSEMPDGKILISTMNAYSFCVLQKDELFQDAIVKSHLVLSDGISIVWAMWFLTGQKLRKIAGADLFLWEMKRLQEKKGKCFFLGSSPGTLKKICARAKEKYPDVIIDSYSPPFRKGFSDEENEAMIEAVNAFSPDVLFIGM